MKVYNYIFYISMCVILLTAGCSEDFEPVPLSYTQLLSGDSRKTWQLSGIILIEENKEPVSFDISVNPIPVNPKDTIQFDFNYDDLYTFYADEGRTLELHQGNYKYFKNAPDIYVTDTWSIVNANSTLNFGTPIFGYTGYTIQRLTERNMVLELFDRQNNYSYRLAFTAQRD